MTAAAFSSFTANTTTEAPRPQVLLVEPQFVLRRTVATVAAELGLADVHEAAGPEAAGRLLAATRFDAMVLDIDAEGRGLRLLAALRAGLGASPPGLPVMALVVADEAPLAATLAGLQVTLRLARPFKAKALLGALEALVR